ncbi:MAG TPA: helix-turn-helix domain-containing protein [Candidatus Binataceae bacterium]|nr:helix-turn-helix domain-containing protein [Candidatus Binataceae bacterium]
MGTRDFGLIDDIQQQVAQAFQLTRAELLSRSRRRPVATARQVAMYLCRDLSGERGAQGAYRGTRHARWASFPRIGLAFARDHSSVMHACRAVVQRQAADVTFARLVEGLACGLRAARAANIGKEV